MRWEDKVALNVSTLPITGSSCRGQVGRLWARRRHRGGNFHALVGKHFPGHIFQLHWEAGPTGSPPPALSNHTSTHSRTHAHTDICIHVNVLTLSPRLRHTRVDIPCLAAEHLFFFLQSLMRIKMQHMENHYNDNIDTCGHFCLKMQMRI